MIVNRSRIDPDDASKIIINIGLETKDVAGKTVAYVRSLGVVIPQRIPDCAVFAEDGAIEWFELSLTIPKEQQ